MAKRVSQFFMVMALVSGFATALPAQSSSLTAQQVAEQKKRFEMGHALYGTGQYDKALELFSKNLEADPTSRGSLLYSALIYIQQGEFTKANVLVDSFLRLEPNNTEGLIAAIKIKQALGRGAEVEVYRKKLFDSRQNGTDKRLKMMMSYEREVVQQSDGSRISILENFDANGTYVWLYLVLDKDKKTIKRRLELTVVPTTTKTYVLAEAKGSDTGSSDYKIHKSYTEQPSYEVAKADALIILLAK